MHTLVLIRHGQSLWNAENRFTGWQDIDLSSDGILEAKNAARTLSDNEFRFDLAYSSVLKRAIRTLWVVLDEMDLMWLPVHLSWRLNERHYGSLTGLNKSETEEKFGSEQVLEWRRSLITQPPKMDFDDIRHPFHDPRYRYINESMRAPFSESLQNTMDRVVPFWNEEIKSKVQQGLRIIVSFHGNSIRGLMKYLEDISDQEIVRLEIPTGVPIVYEFSDDMVVLGRRFLIN